MHPKNISNEDEFQSWLATKFNRQGWEVRREVSPDDSNYRVDLVIENPMVRIGIEAKYANTPGQGAKIAQAYKQITDQYSEKQYDNERIDLWAMSIYFSGKYSDYPVEVSAYERADTFVKNFVVQFGVGYLSLNDRYATISFRPGAEGHNIPAFRTYRNSDEFRMDWSDVDIEAIRKWVCKCKGIKYEPPSSTGLSEFL